MRLVPRTRSICRCRPQLVALEDRLPLGEGVLSVLLGGALLPIHAAAAVEPARNGEPGVSTPGCSAPSRALTRPARLDESLARVFADEPAAVVPAPSWEALPDLFASAARPGSPQREQGSESSPLLALRAVETSVAAPPPGAAPVTAAPVAERDLLATLAAPSQPAALARVSQPDLGAQPLNFEQNVGQTDASVHFFTRGPGYGLFLTSTEAVMVLPSPSAPSSQPVVIGDEPLPPARSASEGSSSRAIRMQFVGGNATPAVTGREELPGKVNYFLGDNPAQWHTNISTFGRVQYNEVYPGIDLVWYGRNGQLEYEFLVAPGVDPSQVRLRFTDADRLEIDGQGDLVLHAGGQQLRQHAPVVYQEVGDARQPVASRFVLTGNEVAFSLDAYDASRPLVIDPVLSYSTYFGGSGLDWGDSLAVDAAGDIYLAGRVDDSPMFPLRDPFQPTPGGGTDGFIMKLSGDGQTLRYSTYFGGNAADQTSSIVVDATGHAYVTGVTSSRNFPVHQAIQPLPGGGFFGDAFVAKFTPTGSALVWSTYLGGRTDDVGYDLALGAAGGDASVYVTGLTSSVDFPTVNPLQAALNGVSDAFVTKIDAAGTRWVYSTYLGGSGVDNHHLSGGHGHVGSIAVDATGSAYVSGSTTSTDFPTVNAVQPTYGGGARDAFVAKLNPAGSALDYATYLGGSGEEVFWANTIAVDATGSAYLAGNTTSTNYPRVNAVQPNYGGGQHDGFITRLSPAGNALVFSTYLGGTSFDIIGDMALDAEGNVHVTGEVGAGVFPLVNPVQSVYGGGSSDGFAAKLNAAGNAWIYATYLGGSGEERAWGIAADAFGNTYVTGKTDSRNYPTRNPLQASYGGGTYDAFLTRLSPTPAAWYYVYPDFATVTAGEPIDLYVFALDAGFNLIPDYTGLILFWATDPLASTPIYHQFQLSDQGFAYFPDGLTFQTPGFQELYIFDWPALQAFGYAAFDVR